MDAIQKIDFTLTPAHGRAFRTDAQFISTDQPKPVVIFVHGFKGFKDWGHFNLLAREFTRQEFVFIKLNLSHNGVTLDGHDLEDMEAFGQNNFSIELDDIGTLLDFLFSKPEQLPEMELDLNKIYLIGHSRGGGLVILKAAEDIRVKAVAAWAPISNIDLRWPAEVLDQWQKTGVHYIYNARIQQDMPLYYQLIENYRANQDRLNIPAAVARLTQPLLIIHGENDETLPVSMAHELKQLQPAAELVIFPEAGHTFGGAHPYPHGYLPAAAQQAANLTIAFFRKL